MMRLYAPSFCLAALVIFLLFLFPRAFAGVPVLMAAAALVAMFIQKSSPPRPSPAFIGVFSALVFTMLLSTLWAVNPAVGLSQSITITGIMIAGIIGILGVSRLNDDAVFRFLAKAMAVGILLAAAFFFFELTQKLLITRSFFDADTPSFAFNRGLVVLVLVLFPTLGMIQAFYPRKRAMGLCFGLMALVALSVSVSQSQSAQLMLLIGLITYGGLSVTTHAALRRGVIYAMGAGMAGVIALMPFGFALLNPYDMKLQMMPSILTSANAIPRLEIWHFTAQKILEKPFLGHGVEAMRVLKADQKFSVNNTYTMLHPHNGFLQIWLELGLVGAVLSLILLWCIIKWIISVPVGQTAIIATSVAAFSLITTGYGLWQGWLIGFLFSIASLCAALRRIPQGVPT